MIIGISGKIGSGKDTVGHIVQGLTLGEHLFVDGIKGFLKNYDDYDASRYPNHWQIRKFAGKIKQCVSIITGIPVEDLEKEEVKRKELGNEYTYWWANGMYDCPKCITVDEAVTYIDKYKNGHIEEKVVTVREMLQLLGTQCGRHIHPNIWINALFADYKSIGTKLKDTCTHPIRSIYDIGECCEDGLLYPNWIITDTRFPNEAKAIKDRGGIVVRIERDLPCENCKLTKVARRGKPCNEIICPDGMPKHPSETALDAYPFDYIISNYGTIEELIKDVQIMLTLYKIK